MNLLLNRVSSQNIGEKNSLTIQGNQILSNNRSTLDISIKSTSHNKMTFLVMDKKNLSTRRNQSSESKEVFWNRGTTAWKNDRDRMSNSIATFSGSGTRKFSCFASRNKSYHFTNNTLGMGQTRKMNGHDNNAVLLLNSFFGGSILTGTSLEGSRTRKNTGNIACIIRKPSFSHTNHKVTIQLFYYTPNEAFSTTNSTAKKMRSNVSFRGRAKDSVMAHPNRRSMLTSLSTYLAQLYKKEVSLVMIRLHYPYLDSYILAQYLAHNAPNNTFIQFQETIFTNAAKAFHSSDLPSHITGIKVQISGRLTTESVIPRITVKSSLIGSFGGSDKGKSTLAEQKTNARNNSSKIRRVIDYSRFTHKNNLGSFTIKVWIASRQ